MIMILFTIVLGVTMKNIFYMLDSCRILNKFILIFLFSIKQLSKVLMFFCLSWGVSFAATETVVFANIGSGSGKIVSSNGTVNCNATFCEIIAFTDQVFTLTAIPDSNSEFRGWNGTCLGTGSCTVTIDKTSNVVATFSTIATSVFTVNNLNDNGFGSLRQAILGANAFPGDDTIIFSEELNGSIILTGGQLTITDPVTIEGPGANIISISGNNASRVIRINTDVLETVFINGLTIINGLVDTTIDGGAGILIDSGTVELDSVTVSNNSATFDSEGGGIRKRGLGVLTINNSTLSFNLAQGAGGGSGGAISINEGYVTINNSTVSGNTALYAGGIAFEPDDPLDTLRINSSTVTTNNASGVGGVGLSVGRLLIRNSLIVGNTASTNPEFSVVAGDFISLGNNIFGLSSLGSLGVININDLYLSDPIITIIGPLVDNGGSTLTHLPTANGPAIDAGQTDSGIVLSTNNDQRGNGFHRINNSAIDIGAVESVAAPKTFIVSNLNNEGNGSLRQAIFESNLDLGNDIINFSSTLHGTVLLDGEQLTITDSVEINGPGANFLKVSGNNVSRVFMVDPGKTGFVNISGVTIKEGHVFFDGGAGILVMSGTVTINDSAILNNITDGGNGGGIRKMSSGSLSIVNVQISDNTALDEFQQGSGGGISNNLGTVTLINTTVSNNFAANGGGISNNFNGILDIGNATITGNSAINFGGGIESNGEFVLANSIIVGNNASSEHEISFFGIDGTTFLSKGHNIMGENSISGISPEMLLASTDKILTGSLTTLIQPLADNGGSTLTHLPVKDGIAIDTGSNSLIPEGVINDQRGKGFPRINNKVVDIGAVEYRNGVLIIPAILYLLY